MNRPIKVKGSMTGRFPNSLHLGFHGNEGANAGGLQYRQHQLC